MFFLGIFSIFDVDLLDFLSYTSNCVAFSYIMTDNIMTDNIMIDNIMTDHIMTDHIMTTTS